MDAMIPIADAAALLGESYYQTYCRALRGDLGLRRVEGRRSWRVSLRSVQQLLDQQSQRHPASPDATPTP